MKNAKKNIVFIFLLVSLALFGQNEKVLIEEANKEYSQGLYDTAIELYQEIINSGYESSELYYNLGNAYFKIHDLASAILYYEKAKKLDPNDEDINFNLNIANTRIVDKIEPVPELFYVRWWNSLLYALSLDDWAKIGLTAFILTFILATIFFLSRTIILRKLSFWAGIILLIISLFTFALSNQKYNSFRQDHEAVIFTPTITVKSSPNEDSIDLFVLHEGTKVQITDHIGGWYEIKIASGDVGWLKSEDLKTI